MHCYDHTGYFSDISIGDIWLQRMKNDPIKHSAVITKTERGKKFLEAAGESGWLHLEAQPIAEIVEAQSRSFKVHYNISARAKAGEKLGLKIKDEVNEPVRWSDYQIAKIILKTTCSPKPMRVFCKRVICPQSGSHYSFTFSKHWRCCKWPGISLL